MAMMMLLSLLPVVAFVLIALSAGCLVCQNAKKDTGVSKTLGYIIGIIIVVIALFSLCLIIVSLPKVLATPQMRQPQQMMRQDNKMRRPVQQPQAAPQTVAPAATEKAPATATK